MLITQAKWTSLDKREVRATKDGVECTIPADPRNSDYAEILARGIEIADYTPSGFNADDITSAARP